MLLLPQRLEPDGRGAREDRRADGGSVTHENAVGMGHPGGSDGKCLTLAVGSGDDLTVLGFGLWADSV